MGCSRPCLTRDQERLPNRRLFSRAASTRKEQARISLGDEFWSEERSQHRCVQTNDKGENNRGLEA
jgi:hypothetical protein